MAATVLVRAVASAKTFPLTRILLRSHYSIRASWQCSLNKGHCLFKAIFIHKAYQKLLETPTLSWYILALNIIKEFSRYKVVFLAEYK
jgi:hypothetical protein